MSNRKDNNIVIPINVDLGNSLSIFKKYSIIISLVFLTKKRETELIYRMMNEFYLLSLSISDKELIYKTLNSTEYRRKVCSQMGIRLEIYRTMLHQLRSKKILKEGNNFNYFHSIIENYLLNFDDIKDEYDITFKLIGK
jgi:hypothetical protein